MDAITDWVIHHFKAEWGMISGAPFLYFFTVCLIGLAAYFLFGKLHEGRHAAHASTVATKDAHISFLEGQLGEYKSKLSGATPDEVASEIGALSANLASARAQLDMVTKWYQYQTSERHLSAEQKDVLAEALKAIPRDAIPHINVCSISEPEAQQYALEIWDVFKSQGFCMGQRALFWTHSDDPSERGVLVVVVDENNPPPHALAVMIALNAAGIEAKFDTFSTPAPPLVCNVSVSHKLPPAKDDAKPA